MISRNRIRPLNSLVTVANKEIRLQLAQIQRDLSDAMGTVNQTQHLMRPAGFHQLLEREPDSRVADDGIEDGNAGVQPVRLGLLDGLLEPPDQLVIANGIPVLDLESPDGGHLGQGDDRLLEGAVDGGEVNDHVALLEEQVPQDRVDARRGILDEHALLHGDVQELGHGGAGLVQSLGKLPADEGVRTRFSGILELAEGGADRGGICPKRA